MTIATGTSVPAITLKHKSPDDLEDVNLQELARPGPTVLLFFPLAFSSVCTDELCSVSGGLDEYEKLDAKVYGVSVDNPLAQEAFARENDLKVPLLSDFNREAVEFFGIVDNDFLPGKMDFKGVAKRSAFVLKDGEIIYAWSSDDPSQLPPFDEVKAALKI